MSQTNHTPQTLTEYRDAYLEELTRYGFVADPLSSDEIAHLWARDIPLDISYLIACDMNGGASFPHALINNWTNSMEKT